MLKDVQGTGVDGRITKEDAQKSQVVSRESLEKVVKEKTVSQPIEKVSGDFSRNERTEKMTRMRKTISRRLVAVKNETAMLTTFNEIDMTRIHQIREQYKKPFEEKNGVGLGFMSFFTKACAIALQKFPAINAYIDDENIIYHDFVDISIAVSTPKGLVVPVSKKCGKLNVCRN
jgi:2-oxoglutarate dehydrogenase E2 component (dihydrolipoamide succinyltransferase)